MGYNLVSLRLLKSVRGEFELLLPRLKQEVQKTHNRLLRRARRKGKSPTVTADVHQAAAIQRQRAVVRTFVSDNILTFWCNVVSATT